MGAEAAEQQALQEQELAERDELAGAGVQWGQHG